MPEVNSSVFDLITVGTEAGSQTGMQILVTGNQGIAFRKAGVKGDGRKWGDWGIYEAGAVPPTPEQRKFACGFIEFSGGLPSQTKTIQNINYASSGFTNPRVFTLSPLLYFNTAIFYHSFIVLTSNNMLILFLCNHALINKLVKL